MLPFRLVNQNLLLKPIMLQKSLVWLHHPRLQPARFREGHPLECLMLIAQANVWTGLRTLPGKEGILHFAVRREDAAGWIARQQRGLDACFLPHLAQQCLVRRFASVKLAAGKFPPADEM